jgi:hypothetical protein
MSEFLRLTISGDIASYASDLRINIIKHVFYKCDNFFTRYHRYGKSAYHICSLVSSNPWNKRHSDRTTLWIYIIYFVFIFGQKLNNFLQRQSNWTRLLVHMRTNIIYFSKKFQLPTHFGSGVTNLSVSRNCQFIYPRPFLLLWRHQLIIDPLSIGLPHEIFQKHDIFQKHSKYKVLN